MTVVSLGMEFDASFWGSVSGTAGTVIGDGGPLSFVSGDLTVGLQSGASGGVEIGIYFTDLDGFAGDSGGFEIGAAWGAGLEVGFVWARNENQAWTEFIGFTISPQLGATIEGRVGISTTLTFKPLNPPATASINPH